MSTMHAYFKDAKIWADDTFGKMEQSKNRYQAAFFAAMGVNMASIAVIGILAHYQTVVPMLVHHYDNGVTTVESMKLDNAPKNRAQVESDIVRYIQHREAYDTSSYRAQFELVNLLSANTVAKEYVTEQGKSNASAPIHLLGNDKKREVHVYSINFLDSMLVNQTDIHKDHHELAEVVFSLTDTDKITGKRTQTQHNALISWRYTNPPASPDTRWQNWDGFEVTRYSKTSRMMESKS